MKNKTIRHNILKYSLLGSSQMGLYGAIPNGKEAWGGDVRSLTRKALPLGVEGSASAWDQLAPKKMARMESHATGLKLARVLFKTNR